MINRQDRKDFLLDRGLSPGEDDSYDAQKAALLKEKADLIAKHGELFDSTKISPLQRINILLGTMREAGPTDGPPSPVDFAKQVIGKSIPTPHEFFSPDALTGTVKAGEYVAKHPVTETAKNVANFVGDLKPSDYAAMLAPGAALHGYRELVPLAARTYIHHMMGIPTPFTHVTEAERQALVEVAQSKIDILLKRQAENDMLNAERARRLNDLRHMPDKELFRHAIHNDPYSSGLSRKDLLDILDSKDEYEIRNAFGDPKKLRQRMIAKYERNNPRVPNETFGDFPANRANVAEDYEKLTGNQLKGFEIGPALLDDELGVKHDFRSALGKTYVEPMKDKLTGQIIPKRIQDTYKFYPDVYGYGDETKLVNVIKQLFSNIKYNKLIDQPIFKNVFNMDSYSPLGAYARKAAFGRPTTIIDIPLTKPGPMNAYDKAAILLGAKQLAGDKK